MAATYLSARAKGIAAMDEQDQAAIDQGWAPPGTVVLLSAQLAQVGVPQAQYDTVVAERDARQAAILVIRANANARKAADATSVDGQADLDAIAAF